MAKYRKRPVVIEAEVYRPGMEDGFAPDRAAPYCNAGCQDSCYSCNHYRPFIKTLEGPLFISPGDYIVTGVKGERYPVKPDIFLATYEPVEG